MVNELYGGLNERKMSDARLALHGRILRCPMGGNPKSCPLHEIRLLPVQERIMWLESKTDEAVEVIYRSHVACLAQKRAELQAE